MNKKVTTEEIKKRIYNKVKDEYIVISEYKGGSKYIDLLHKKCGNKYTVTPNHFLYDGSRCKCTLNAKSPDKFRKQFIELSKDEYVQLTPYRRSTEKIKIKHIKCGNIFEMRPGCFLSGHRCPKCYGTVKKTTKEFGQEVEKLSKGEYELKSEYKNNHTKVKIKHNICNYEYMVTPKDYLRGNRCPLCKQSKGERMVKYILESLGVEYEIEKCYEELKVRGKYLPFDFYIPSLNLLIEYDGIQHKEPVKYFGGTKKLDSQRRRDNMKNKYAEENNLKLIRIEHTLDKDQVREILSNYIDS